MGMEGVQKGSIEDFFCLISMSENKRERSRQRDQLHREKNNEVP